MRRSFNAKLFLLLLAVLGVLGTGGYFLHAYQVKRCARTFFAWAAEEQAKSNTKQALRYLGLGLASLPDDPDALVQYGDLTARTASRGKDLMRSVGAYEKVLVAQPRRVDLRRKLAGVYLRPELRQFDQARDQLMLVYKDAPKDADVERELGECAQGLGDYNKAYDYFKAAIEHQPHNCRAYALQADLLEQHLNRPGQAEGVLNAMVETNKDSAEAYLTRARHALAALRRQEQNLSTTPVRPSTAPSQLSKDLASARQLASNDVEVLLASAEWASIQARKARLLKQSAEAGAALREARGYLQRAAELQPDNIAPYQYLADLEYSAGRPEQAIAALERGVTQLKKKHQTSWMILAWSLAESRLNDGKSDAAKPLIEELTENRLAAPLVEYLAGRLDMGEGKWAQALSSLEELRPQFQSSPDVLANMPDLKQHLGDQIDLLLCRCYAEVGDSQRRYEAARRAVMRAPLSIGARLSLGDALAALDKVDEAIDEYRKVQKDPRAKVPLARMLMIRTLRQPPKERRWKDINDLLKTAATESPDEVRVPLVQAEVLLRQDPPKIDEARQKLREACKRWPKNAAVWDALAAFEMNQQHVDEARRILEAGERQVGREVDMRLTWAGYWARLGAAPLRDHLNEVLKGSKQLTRGEQKRLLRRLTELCVNARLMPEAKSLCEQLVNIDPLNVISLRSRFELAIATGDESLMLRTLEAFAARKDEGGPIAKFDKARYLVWKAEHGDKDKKKLDDAASILDELVRSNPTWAAVIVTQAQLDDLRNDSAAALSHYRRAIELGESRSAVLARTLQLYYQRGMYPEAEDLVRRLPQEVSGSGPFKRMVLELSLKTAASPEQFLASLEKARKSVARDSKDYQARLMLGQGYFVAGQTAEAEAMLRSATRVAEQVPETWVVLVRFLVRVRKTDEAIKVIGECARHLPAKNRDLGLGQCWDAVGDSTKAAEYLGRALRDHPKDITALRVNALFCLRRKQQDKAMALLHRIIDAQTPSPEDREWAKNLLAVLLTTGDYQKTREALALLGYVEETTKLAEIQTTSIDKQRALALVLAQQRSGNERALAVTILRGLDDRQALQPEDLFLLAQLYDRQGQWREARQCLLRLVGNKKADPRYATYYAAALLKHGQPGDLDEAESLVAGLGQPNNFAVVHLRAQILARRKHPADAIALLQKYADNEQASPANPATRLQQAALTLAGFFRLDNHPAYGDAADEMYRRWVDKTNQPESRLAWAAYLADRGRIDMALNECERSSATPEQVGFALLGVLHQAPDVVPYASRVERWLRQALARDPRSSGLHVCLADLRDLQGRYEEAEKLYANVLAGNPAQLVALNNLAWLLAMKDKNGVQAEGRISQAIKLAGPMPELLDTRAMVYLAAGRIDDAIADLREALKNALPEARVVPSLHFHLARVYKEANQLKEARNEWEQAVNTGLKAVHLHPLDRDVYRQLESQLGGKSSP